MQLAFERHDDIDDALYAWGGDGWELVSVVASPWENFLLAFLKRPVPLGEQTNVRAREGTSKENE